MSRRDRGYTHRRTIRTASRNKTATVTYIRTDKDLPPVAIIDRSPITTRHKIIFGIIALLGAIAWAVIAFFRGETVNAVWFVIAAICTYVIGFRFYAPADRDEDRPPARRPRNTGRSVRERHRLHADRPARAVRPSLRRDRRRRVRWSARCLPTQMGYLPGTIWIIIGAVFAGCVQDYLVLWISTRRRGRSLGQMVRDELGAVGGAAAIIGIITIMTILLAVLALVVVQALRQSPWGVFSIAMTIPIALFMGVYLRFLRPGRVSRRRRSASRCCCWPSSRAAGSPKHPGGRVHGSACPR